MQLIAIVAHDENLLIGRDGGLPWHIPEDLRHFKRVTTGYPILMGRKVFEEIGRKPLPNRRNVVLTSGHYPGIECYYAIDKALQALKEEDKVFVIGGGEIYRQLLENCTYMYVTLVEGMHDGDVFFPEYRHQLGSVWVEQAREIHEGYTFLEYKRS